MTFITRKDLSQLYSQKINRKGFEAINNFLYRRKKYTFEELEEKKHVSVYLSHADSDDELIVEIAVLLMAHGENIYVDWKDRSMPKIRNAITAKRLKNKILENRKFILLVSNESVQSSWLPWELGFADPYKYIRNLAILPIADSEGIWQGADYLKLYPTIEKKSIDCENKPGNYHVNFGGGHQMELLKWLRE